MAQLSLIDRFTFGQVRHDYPDAHGATDRERVVSELLTAAPNRQRAVIALAEYQIQAQERQAAMLSTSTAAGAQLVTSEISHQVGALSASTAAGSQLVANEISQQTEQLRNTLERVRSTLSEDIGLAATEIASAINEVGTLLNMELAEIQWQLLQQNETLDQILHVLQENRSNEARQLVSQGIRLKDAGQYDKAEERFRRALDYDMTDYQVLMNLGFIESHKDNSDSAMQFFQDALTLPANLDAVSKARTFWNMAVVKSRNGHYDDAIRLGDRSLELDKDNGEHLYSTAVWTAQVGQADESIRRLRMAIALNRCLFTTASIDTGFEPIREDVANLLVLMATDAHVEADRLACEFTEKLNRISKSNAQNMCGEHLTKLRSICAKYNKCVPTPCYSGDIEYARVMSRVTPILSKVVDIASQIDENIRHGDMLREREGELRLSYDGTRSLYEGSSAITKPVSGGERMVSWGCLLPLAVVGSFFILSAIMDARANGFKGFIDVGDKIIGIIFGLIILLPGAFFFLFYLGAELEGWRRIKYAHINRQMKWVRSELESTTEYQVCLRKEIEALCWKLQSL